MKLYKSLSFALLFLVAFASAQTSANRFFYELTYKPKQKVDSLQKAVVILDVSDKKSIYKDYLTVSQDSLIKIEVDKMMKAGMFKDISKSFQQPKFAFKVIKEYPSMKVNFNERMLNSVFGYEEEPKFNWQITNEKQKIGDYEAQKATTEFGGRQWTAWFTPEIPIQDGPYKFSGLPGLIVKIEDAGQNYLWTLEANKKLNQNIDTNKLNFLEFQMGEAKKISKDGFVKRMSEYRKNPMGQMSQWYEGKDAELMKKLKEQETREKQKLNHYNNPVEL